MNPFIETGFVSKFLHSALSAWYESNPTNQRFALARASMHIIWLLWQRISPEYSLKTCRIEKIYLIIAFVITIIIDSVITIIIICITIIIN